MSELNEGPERKVIVGGIAAKASPAKISTGPLVEDTSVVGGTDKETGAPVIRPKTSGGRADESVEPTDKREHG